MPDLSTHPGPAYRGIADAIASSVRDRELAPGERLPTQRELARRLGLTVGTVTRGYSEARRRGLVSGEVGRGTFVRRERPAPIRFALGDPSKVGKIDLSLNLPVPTAADRHLVDEMAPLTRDGRLSRALGYEQSRGATRHRTAGAAWTRRFGLAASPDQVVVTCGAQHGLLIVLATHCQPGDTVVTEALTYPGMTAVAGLFHLRVEGVAIDDAGLRPEALEDACRRHAPKVLYVQPSVHNPTAVVMPATRRAEVAAVARRYDIAIVEDDTYGFLAPGSPAPIAQLAPERTYFVTSLSKSLIPALRVGFVHAPRAEDVQSLDRAMMASTWMASPLCAEIAAAWIESGVAERAVAGRLEETAARRTIALRTVGRYLGDRRSRPGHHLWLALPEPWRVEDFVYEARARGVLVSSSEMFIVGRSAAPHAVRLCLGAPETRARLAEGLEIVAELLESSPAPVRSSL